MGEEILEGLGGGLMVGVPMYFQDNDPGAATLGLAGAIAGGISLGMAGRRIGGWAGKQIHPEAFKHQTGPFAAVGRIGGMETIGEAAEENAKLLRTAIADDLMRRKGAAMVRDGEITIDELNGVNAINDALAANELYKRMSEEQRMQVRSAIQKQASRIAGEYADVEQKIATGAVQSMDELLDEVATGVDGLDSKNPVSQLIKGDDVRNLKGELKPMTGEHFGRAVGRFAGDEIGIFGGSLLGMSVANAMGIQTPKDREIERLKAELAKR